MELSINTPALLFPAITLLMLAYTNRFLGLSSRIRSLHDKYATIENRESLLKQIKNLRLRLHIIRYMQLLGSFSFLSCLVCMFCIYKSYVEAANIVFAISLASLSFSIMFSLYEIQISTKAMEIELSDMEGLDSNNVLVNYIKNTFQKD